ncbi:Hypothetical protein GLP15_881 [Giardia lamblia P15]|uniref:Uncharacterized protein n=1 Tax=Giardia intestinalis (strain P15) TaxID=658858 RepID=E1F2P9_GIAIA|nr:Hypothetical protein GLP15_881 [Giardia lamblia P15]
MQNRFFGFKKKLSSSQSTKLITTNMVKIIAIFFQATNKVMRFSDQFLARVASQLDLKLLFRFQSLSQRTYEAGYQVTALNNVDLHYPGLNKVLIKYRKVQRASIISLYLAPVRPIGVLFYRYWVDLKFLSFTFQRCDIFVNFISTSLIKGKDEAESEKSFLALTDLSITIYTTGDSKYCSPLSVFPPVHAAKIRRLLYDCKFETRIPTAFKNFTAIQDLTLYGPSEPNFRLISMPSLKNLRHLVIHKANLYSVEILAILKSNPTIEILEIHAISLDPPQDDGFSLVTICSDLERKDGTLCDEQDNQYKQAFRKKYRLNPYKTVTNLKSIMISTAGQVPLDIITLVTACSPHLIKLSISNSVFISRHFIKETRFLDILKENFTCHSVLSLACTSTKEQEEEKEREHSKRPLALSADKNRSKSKLPQQNDVPPDADLSGIKLVTPTITGSLSSGQSSIYSGLSSNTEITKRPPFSSTIKACCQDVQVTTDSMSTPELTSSVVFEQNDMSKDDLKATSLKNYLPCIVTDALAQIKTDYRNDADPSSDDTIPPSLFKYNVADSSLPSFQIRYSESQPHLVTYSAPYSSISNTTYGDNIPDSTFSFQSSVYSMSTMLHNPSLTIDGYSRNYYDNHLARNRSRLSSATNGIQSTYNDIYNSDQDSTRSYVLVNDEPYSRSPSDGSEDSGANQELDREQELDMVSFHHPRNIVSNKNVYSGALSHLSNNSHQMTWNFYSFLSSQERMLSHTQGTWHTDDSIHKRYPFVGQLSSQKKEFPFLNKQLQPPYYFNDPILGHRTSNKDRDRHGGKYSQRPNSVGKCSGTSVRFFTKCQDATAHKQRSNESSQLSPLRPDSCARRARMHTRVYSSMNDYSGYDVFTTSSTRTETSLNNSDTVSVRSVQSYTHLDVGSDEKASSLPPANLDTNFSCGASLPSYKKTCIIPLQTEEEPLNNTGKSLLDGIPNNPLLVATAKESPHTSVAPSPSISSLSLEQPHQPLQINLSKTTNASDSSFEKYVTMVTGVSAKKNKPSSLSQTLSLFIGSLPEDLDNSSTTKPPPGNAQDAQDQQTAEGQVAEGLKPYASAIDLVSRETSMAIPHNPGITNTSTFSVARNINSLLQNVCTPQDSEEDLDDAEEVMPQLLVSHLRAISTPIVHLHEFEQSTRNMLISERVHNTKCFISHDDAWVYIGKCMEWTEEDKIIAGGFYQQTAWKNAAFMCQRYEKTYMDMARSAGVLDVNTDEATFQPIIKWLHQGIRLKGPKQLKTAYLWSNYHMLSPIYDDYKFTIRDMQNELFQAKMNSQLAAIEPFFNTNISGKPFYQTKTANTGYVEKIILTSNKLRASMTVVANASVSTKERGMDAQGEKAIAGLSLTSLSASSQSIVVPVISDKQASEKLKLIPEGESTKPSKKNSNGSRSEQSIGTNKLSSLLAVIRNYNKTVGGPPKAAKTQLKNIALTDSSGPDLIQGSSNPEINPSAAPSTGNLDQNKENRKVSEQQNTSQLLDIFRKDIQLIDLHEVHDIYSLPFNKNLVAEPDKMLYFDMRINPCVDQIIGQIITHDMLEQDKKEHVQKVGDSFDGFSQTKNNTLFCNILLISTLSKCITRIHMPSIHLSVDDILLMAARFKNLRSLEIGSLPTPTSDFRDALSVRDTTDDALEQRPRAKSDGGAAVLDGAPNSSVEATMGFMVPASFSRTIISFPSMTELFLRNGYMVDILLILQLFPNLKCLQLENCVLLNTVTNEMAFCSTNEFRKQFVLEELTVIGSLKTDRMTLRNIMLLLRDTLTTVYLNRTRIPLHNIWRNNVVYMPKLRHVTLQSAIYDETTEMDEYIARYPKMTNYGRCSLSLLDLLAVIACYPNLETLSFSQLHTFDYGGVHEAVSSAIILRILDHLSEADGTYCLKRLRTLSLRGASEGDVDVFILTMAKICDMKSLTRVSLELLFWNGDILKPTSLQESKLFSDGCSISIVLDQTQETQ